VLDDRPVTAAVTLVWLLMLMFDADGEQGAVLP
jgi:hypothetical protein